MTANCVLNISQCKAVCLCFGNRTDSELLTWLWTCTKFLVSFTLAWKNTWAKDKTCWFIFAHSLLHKYCHNIDLLKYMANHNFNQK